MNTLLARDLVLRAKKSIENYHFNGDTLENTVLFGLYSTYNLLEMVPYSK
ncbi:hypothetical protein [Flavobacterium sp. LB2R40]